MNTAADFLTSMAQRPIRNGEQQKFLEQFLESSACPPNSMNFYQLDGYLRAICCGPGLAPPSDWLPLIFNDEQPHYRDADEAQSATTAILDLYNFHVDQVAVDACELPMSMLYSAERARRVDQEQWARGFLQGYIYWEQVWSDLLKRVPTIQIEPRITIESMDDELDRILAVVSAVADVEFAVNQGIDPENLEDIFGSLCDSLILCGRIGKTLYQFERDQV